MRELRGAADPVLIDQPLINSPLVTVGRFRLSAGHAEFATAGPISRHCFVFPRRAVWIRHRDEQAFVGDATRVALYNPGAEYRREVLDPAGDFSDWFGIAESVLRDALRDGDPAASEAEARLFRRSYAAVDAQLYFRQRRLYEYVRFDTQPDLLLVEEAVLGLLSEVLEAVHDPAHADSSRVRREHQAIVEATCAALNRCFWRSDSLSQIAGSVGVSVFHLCRVFRQVTGGTIHQHREQLRLRTALQAVTESREDLLSIAVRLGYSGHSHFTGAFHRWFGVTPSAARRLRQSITARVAGAGLARP